MSHYRFSLRGLLLGTTLIALGLSVILEEPQFVLMKTGKQCDFAIAGDGFFVLLDEESAELLHTRSGTFTLDADGRFVLQHGQASYPLEPPIHFPTASAEIAVSTSGEVRAYSHSAWSRTGQFLLASNMNGVPLTKPQSIERYTEKSFRTTSKCPGDGGMGYVLQGWLEVPRSISWSRFIALLCFAFALGRWLCPKLL